MLIRWAFRSLITPDLVYPQKKQIKYLSFGGKNEPGPAAPNCEWDVEVGGATQSDVMGLKICLKNPSDRRAHTKKSDQQNNQILKRKNEEAQATLLSFEFKIYISGLEKHIQGPTF